MSGGVASGGRSRDVSPLLMGTHLVNGCVPMSFGDALRRHSRWYGAVAALARRYHGVVSAPSSRSNSAVLALVRAQHELR